MQHVCTIQKCGRLSSGLKEGTTLVKADEQCGCEDCALEVKMSVRGCSRELSSNCPSEGQGKGEKEREEAGVTKMLMCEGYKGKMRTAWYSINGAGTMHSA